jgi:hypothetical protein
MQIYLDDSINSFEDYTARYRELAALKARATTTYISVDDRTLKRCIQNYNPFASHEDEEEFEHAMRSALTLP